MNMDWAPVHSCAAWPDYIRTRPLHRGDTKPRAKGEIEEDEEDGEIFRVGLHAGGKTYSYIKIKRGSFFMKGAPHWDSFCERYADQLN